MEKMNLSLLKIQYHSILMGKDFYGCIMLLKTKERFTFMILTKGKEYQLFPLLRKMV
jgi:hypothetical protein